MPKQHEPAVRNTEIYSSRTTFQHIDDFLGNSQSRFFGNGYKLTNPLLKETLLSETTDGILSLENQSDNSKYPQDKIGPRKPMKFSALT